MIRNGFTAKCDSCKGIEPTDGCATVIVYGTNAFGDREPRRLNMCGKCRKDCRGRITLHPKHHNNKTKGV